MVRLKFEMKTKDLQSYTSNYASYGTSWYCMSAFFFIFFADIVTYSRRSRWKHLLIIFAEFNTTAKFSGIVPQEFEISNVLRNARPRFAWCWCLPHFQFPRVWCSSRTASTWVRSFSFHITLLLNTLHAYSSPDHILIISTLLQLRSHSEGTK